MFYLKLRERDARDLLRELRDHRAGLGKPREAAAAALQESQEGRG